MAKFVGIDENRPHIVYVAVTVKEPRLVDGQWVMVDNTVEIPARRSHWEALSTNAEREAYAQECAEYHCGGGPGWEHKRTVRRAVWTADDKAEAEATAVRATAEEEARFVMRPIGFSTDGKSVRISVSHHGIIADVTVPNDAKKAKTNARAAFAEVEAKILAERKVLATFAIE